VAQGTIAPIYSIDQIAADPQVRAREVITRIPDKDFGSIATPCVVPRFAIDPTSQRNAAGDIGQDNEEFYVDGLGLAHADFERLARDKVI
jgi:crotonobetainyl-CoA:carnitine CoA-transferase CaiB-like acyl-CoA transferase